ncbi:MAG: ABC transporter substrate-binding protein [Candidatus Marinarcus sp.]|uniref:ABC transporter substrate-binding protein n=1 Tax=Candidatus Marinarcus sp. TaxID=3100987 RepID=UPI003B00104E
MKTKILFILLILLISSSLFSRTITDMSNNQIEVPNNIERIFGSAPPTTFLVALYNPELLVGLNFPAYNQNNLGSEAYLGKHFMSLPVLGGWHGNQKGASIEKLLSVHAQIILSWQNDFLLKKVQTALKKVEIPIVMVEADNLEKSPEMFRFVGELLNKPTRGEALALYAQKALQDIQTMTAKIPEDKRVSFYYAQGQNGLQSDCSNSFHTTQFRFIKAKNIYECTQKSIMGMESINFETILKANPDYIIVQSPQFYKEIFSSVKWKMLDAVKLKKVYLVPRTPFNWIDRPPSFMRLLGIHWLSSIMYPEYYTQNINDEIKAFYKLFFNFDLDDDTLSKITKAAF